MAAIGSLVFCTDCGNLLDGSTGNEKAILVCDVCGTHNKDTASTSTTAYSKPSAFPSVLRQKHSQVQTLTEDDYRNEQEVNQTCPECGSRKMTFTQAQLRGADEGSTVFYTCSEKTCGHTFTVNN